MPEQNQPLSIDLASQTGQQLIAEAISNLSISNTALSLSRYTIQLSSTWTGTDPYTQVVTIPDVTITKDSKVDIQANETVLSTLMSDGVKALWIENNNGTLTAKALGAAPTTALSVQCTISDTQASSAILDSKTITENGTYLALDDNLDGYSEVIVDVESGSTILSGQNAPTSEIGNNGDIYLICFDDAQITDLSECTPLYNTSINFGNNGNKVLTRLMISDESSHAALMNNGWTASGAAYYDSENLIGAYGGYEFLNAINISKVKLWIGRYSEQNTTLIVTLQYKDNNDTWNDILDLDITSSLPYPLNVFDCDVLLDVYGIRWIHKKTPNKSSGNNIIFFGMSIYTTSISNTIRDAYFKVDNQWQPLIGSDIDDMNTEV